MLVQRTGIGLAFLWLLLMLATPAMAGKIPPQEALETLRRGFAGVNDFSAEIIQEKQISLMQKKLISKGLVRFRRPGWFYMELFPPYASQMLLKDGSLELAVPGETARQRTVIPREESLQRWLTYLDRPVSTLPDGVDLNAERQGGTVTLQIAPRNRRGIRAIRFVMTEDGRLRQLVMEELNGDRTTIQFRKMRRNLGLSEADFRLD